MNKKTRIGLALLLTAIFVLALTVPAMAWKTPNFFIEYTFDNVDWDNYFATGTFDLVTHDRYGEATVSWLPSSSVKRGTMSFMNDDDLPEGSFAIKFTVPQTHAVGCGTGTFKLIDATGEYEGRMASGVIEICKGDETYFYGTLEGMGITKHPDW